MAAPQRFVPLPANETLRIEWPTPNHCLFHSPDRFFARTRANGDYGKPGFTRDCGRRFHRGVDIAAVNAAPAGGTTKVVFTDCATGRDYESEEPIFVPRDAVFCVCDGVIHERVSEETNSDYGKHVVIAHQWPGSGAPFFTLYAHLAEVGVAGSESTIRKSSILGQMGQTSRSPDARNWMAIAPHLHFEVRSAEGELYDPVQFLLRFLPRDA